MKDLITKLITAFMLIFATAITVLYSEGWRLNYLNSSSDEGNSSDTVIKTGMIAVRSIPEGAKVYINDELLTATDDTITNLVPRKYTLKVEREGFEIWEKEVEVYPDLVTDITAVLVLQSPKLEPLTSLNVGTMDLSYSQNDIIFTSANTTEPGLWLLPLNRAGLNLFRNETQIIAADTKTLKPSLAKSIEWSEDDASVITENIDGTYSNYFISNGRLSSTENISDLQEFKQSELAKWKKDFLTDKLTILQKQNAPEEVMTTMEETLGTWSPDSEKFYLIKSNNLIVYNTETPLPIGEKRIYETIANYNPETTAIYWYSDSYHLITVEQDAEKSNYYSISLIRIDGTNKTTIYSGTLASNKAYPNPTGDRIIVLTSLKENTPTNIYSIGLR